MKVKFDVIFAVNRSRHECSKTEIVISMSLSLSVQDKQVATKEYQRISRLNLDDPKNKRLYDHSTQRRLEYLQGPRSSAQDRRPSEAEPPAPTAPEHTTIRRGCDWAAKAKPAQNGIVDGARGQAGRPPERKVGESTIPRFFIVILFGSEYYSDCALPPKNIVMVALFFANIPTWRFAIWRFGNISETWLLFLIQMISISHAR